MEEDPQPRFGSFSLANFVLELSILVFELLLQFLDIEVIAHTSEDFLNLKRFGDVVYPTHLKGMDFIHGII